MLENVRLQANLTPKFDLSAEPYVRPLKKYESIGSPKVMHDKNASGVISKKMV